MKLFTQRFWLLVITCLTAGLSLPAIAQPIIELQHMYGPGTRQGIAVIDPVPPGVFNVLTGPNRFWNLSSVPPAQFADDSLILVPALGTPFDTSYPAATFAQEFSASLSSDPNAKGFVYFSTVGGWGTAGFQYDFPTQQQGADLLIRGRARYFSPTALALVNYPLPLHYEDSIIRTSTYALDQEVDIYVNKVYVQTQRTRVRSQARNTVTAPAWGTVRLPGTTTDTPVLLARRELVVSDTAYLYDDVSGTWNLNPTIQPNPTLDTAVFYDWLSTDGRFVLLSAPYDRNNNSIDAVQYVMPAVPVGTKPVARKPTPVAFPNPAGPEGFDLDLSTLPGVAIDAVQLVAANGKTHTIVLNRPVTGEVITLRPTGYAPGAYVWRAMSNGQVQATGKVVLGN